MIEDMFKRLLGNRNVKLIHAGKVRACPLTGIVYLRKENLFSRTVQSLPRLDPTLKSTELTVVILAWVSSLEIIKDGMGLQCRLCVFQKLDDKGPVIGKRIPACRPSVLDPALTGQFAGFSVLTGGFTANAGSISRLITVFIFVLHGKQYPYLLICDHLKIS